MGISSALSGAVGFVPAGVVVPFAGSSAPANWLLCDGSAVSRTTYGQLFAAISTTYGSGDGSTTFNLPDMRGRVAAGKDDMGGSAASRLTSTTITSGATTLGNSGGAQTHTMTTSEMPSHTHTQDSHNHTQNSHNHIQDQHRHGPGNETNFVTNSGQLIAGLTAGNALYSPFNASANTAYATATNQAQTATNIATTATNQNTGGGGAHNNVQPTIILNYIIKA